MATFAPYYPGLGLTDEKFKSTVSAPVVSSIDITGCGSNTHTKAGYAANFNYRLGCGSIEPLVSFSFKSTVANQLANIALSGDHSDGVGKAFAYLDLFDVRARAAYETPIGPSPTLLPLQTAGFGSPAQLVGSSYVFTSATGNVRTFTVPRFKAIRGCNNVVIGYKISTAYTELTFDPITCTPRLAFATSASITQYLKSRVTGINLGYLDASTVSSILTDSKVNPVTFSAQFAGLPVTTLPETAAALWPTLGLGGTLYNIGTFA